MEMIMKTQKELIKMLQIIENVELFFYDSTWELVCKIVTSIEMGSCEVVNKQWSDSWKSGIPLEIEKTKTWGNKNKFSFTYKNKKLHCVATSYELGWDKNPTINFEANLIFPLNFIKNLSSQIEFDFKDFLNDQYEEHLREKRKNWIKIQREKLLSGS